PPVVSRALARRSKHATRFVDGYGSWDEATAAATGYDHDAILSQVEKATTEVVDGRAEFERDGTTFDQIEYRWPVAAALMWQAARRKGVLNVLDFGGSLGSTYRQYSRLLADLDVRWGVVEQATFVAAGRRFADGHLSFHDDIESCARSLHPNLGLFSSVLQYLPDPYAVIDAVAATGVEILVIDRTPMTNTPADIPAVQVVPESIYAASYPSWLLSRERLINHLSDWELIDTFPGIEPDLQTKGGTAVSWLGMTFARQPS
ncbi:MAG: methyltransferase, TIGR04325 family, partial [bacterium]|nr:methyltransferase, TIGR04325 family [bacterium]